MAATLTASTIIAFGRRMAKDRAGAKADTMLMECLNDSMLHICKNHRLPFYLTRSQINIHQLYDTGTVTLTEDSATVTGSGTTFPSWAASGEIRVDGKWYDISTRDSDTQLTLTTAYNGDTVSGKSFVLYQDAYDLPADLLHLDSIYQGTNAIVLEEASSLQDVLRQKDLWQQTNSRVYVYATGNDDLFIWPPPSNNTDINILYYRKPTKVTATSDTLDFPDSLEDLLHTAMSYYVTLRFGTSNAELNAGDYLEALRQDMNRMHITDQRARRSGGVGTRARVHYRGDYSQLT